MCVDSGRQFHGLNFQHYQLYDIFVVPELEIGSMDGLSNSVGTHEFHTKLTYIYKYMYTYVYMYICIYMIYIVYIYICTGKALLHAQAGPDHV